MDAKALGAKGGTIPIQPGESEGATSCNVQGEDIKNIQEEMKRMSAEVITTSPVEYYHSNKSKSYPINPAHEHRGRALVVTMTEDRDGWKEDVRALQKCFLSLNFRTEHVFNPTKEELFWNLSQFALNEENQHVDMLFVVFMGHGCSKGNNTYLQTKSSKFEIWSHCSQIFKTAEETITCLKSKPKVVLAQLCRREMLDDLQTSLEPAPIKDYMLVFASQPGQEAMRNTGETSSGPKGSIFIQHISTVTHQHSSTQPMEALVKIVQRLFNVLNIPSSGTRQMPQCWSTTLLDTNIFPGITVSRLREDEAQEEREKMPEEALDIQQHKQRPHNPSETIPTISDARPDLLIKVDIGSPESDTGGLQTSQRCTEILVRGHLQSGIQKHKLSDFFTKHMGETVRVNNITEGCLGIHCVLDDYSSVHSIKRLCDTGVVASIFESFIARETDLNVDITNVVVSLDENSFSNILDYNKAFGGSEPPDVLVLEDRMAFLQQDVRMECDLSGNVKWYKDGTLIKDNPRVSQQVTAAASSLIIKDATSSDAGRYQCRLDSPKPSIREFRLIIFEQGCPRDLEAKTVSTDAVHVTWKMAPGNITGYKVKYHLKEDPSIHDVVTVDGQDTESAIVNGLLPGQSYSLSVVSVNGALESDAAPSGTILFQLRPDNILAVRQEEKEQSLNIYEKVPANIEYSGDNVGSIEGKELQIQKKADTEFFQSASEESNQKESIKNQDKTGYREIHMLKGASGEGPSTSSHLPTALDPVAILASNRVELVEKIDLLNTSLGYHMLKFEIITDKDLEALKGCEHTYERNRTLLKYMERCSWIGFIKFWRALRLSGHQALVTNWPIQIPEEEETSGGMKHKLSVSDKEEEDKSKKKRISVNAKHEDIDQQIKRELKFALLEDIKKFRQSCTLDERKRHIDLVERLTRLGGSAGDIGDG